MLEGGRLVVALGWSVGGSQPEDGSACGVSDVWR